MGRHSALPSLRQASRLQLPLGAFIKHSEAGSRTESRGDLPGIIPGRIGTVIPTRIRTDLALHTRFSIHPRPARLC